MSEPSDRLIAAEIRAELDGCRIGNEIVVVEEAGSTNDLAWEAAGHGAAQGFVVFAERQTKGRGQYGRRWDSAPYHGLWLSILLRPALTLRESPRLTSLLAEVVAAAIVVSKKCPRPRRYNCWLMSSSTATRSADDVSGATAKTSANVWLASQPRRPVTPSMTASRYMLSLRVRTT